MHSLEYRDFQDRCYGAGRALCAVGVLLLYDTMLLEALIIIVFSFSITEQLGKRIATMSRTPLLSTQLGLTLSRRVNQRDKNNWNKKSSNRHTTNNM